MSYQLDPNGSYMMPTHFNHKMDQERMARFKGIAPDEGIKIGTTADGVIAVTTSFLTEKEHLEALLPAGKGLELRGEPVLSVTSVYQSHVAWLAGRGYNLIVVNFPVSFNGKKDKATGVFNPVVWENMYEPIASGRERLGWSKIYSEIPPLTVYDGTAHCVASWYGFKFMDQTITNLKQLTEDEIKERTANPPQSDGSMHYKYIGKTGVPGEADADYITLSTNKGNPATIEEMWVGDGNIEFHPAKWEDMPTMYHIVNALAAMPVKKIVGAVMVKNSGGSMGPTVIIE